MIRADHCSSIQIGIFTSNEIESDGFFLQNEKNKNKHRIILLHQIKSRVDKKMYTFTLYPCLLNKTIW